MNLREIQLREKDVRKDAPELNPQEFLSLYLVSTFPQTAALPSKEQKLMGITPQSDPQGVNYMKKPLSGTSFDNPASY
jgi:hypothetical protein